MAAGHPFDLIKTRLQTMVVAPGQTPPYTGAIDAFRKTFAKEGVSGARRTEAVLNPLHTARS